MEHVRFEPVLAERCVQEAERLRSEAQQLNQRGQVYGAEKAPSVAGLEDVPS